MKKDYQKALKKLTLFFLPNAVPFIRQDYEKQKGSGTKNQLLFRLQNMFRKIPLFMMYCLIKCDDVTEIIFCVIPKITPANLCKPIHDSYSTFICPFESGKCGKEGKKLQEFEHLKNKKGFLDETFFIVFEGLTVVEKVKNSRHKL